MFISKKEYKDICKRIKYLEDEVDRLVWAHKKVEWNEIDGTYRRYTHDHLGVSTDTLDEVLFSEVIKAIVDDTPIQREQKVDIYLLETKRK